MLSSAECINIKTFSQREREVKIKQLILFTTGLFQVISICFLCFNTYMKCNVQQKNTLYLSEIGNSLKVHVS